jgi:putative NADH-flavin reductase
MKILVVGATGGSGRAAVARLLEQGHEVTALVRNPAALSEAAPEPRLRQVLGDATNARDVEHAVMGQDAVIVTLGISENPLRVRLRGPACTPLDVRSVGTRHVITAMRKHGVRRLVVQTSYGVGDTRDRLGFLDALFFKLLLKPQIEDTEVQDREVKESGLDWVLAQPVHLTDGEDAGFPFSSSEGATGTMKVSRKSVGRFLAQAVRGDEYVRRTVAISGVAPG